MDKLDFLGWLAFILRMIVVFADAVLVGLVTCLPALAVLAVALAFLWKLASKVPFVDVSDVTRFPPGEADFREAGEATAAPGQGHKSGSVGGHADRGEDAGLAEASHAADDLVHAGDLDKAEQAARELLVRFPDVYDGYYWLGMVCEARGDDKQAAYYYRRALEFVRQHPGGYGDAGIEAVVQNLAAGPDAPTP